MWVAKRMSPRETHTQEVPAGSKWLSQRIAIPHSSGSDWEGSAGILIARTSRTVMTAVRADAKPNVRSGRGSTPFHRMRFLASPGKGAKFVTNHWMAERPCIGKAAMDEGRKDGKRWLLQEIP